MNIAEIFQKTTETRLLERLAEHRGLCFAGDAHTLDFLRSHPSLQGKPVEFAVFEPESRPPAGSQTLIAVSTSDEGALKTRIADTWGVAPLRLFGDVLVNLLAERDLLEPAPAPGPFPDRAYAIVTTPRSGSTLLSQMLASTGVAGQPKEHLRLPTQTLSRECGFDYIRLLRILAAERATPNRVFGTKLIVHFLEKHQPHGEDFGAVARAFKFINLVRMDRVAQAVSLHLAQSTGIWHVHNDQTRKVYDEKIKAIRIDQGHIDGVRAMHTEIRREEGSMAEIFDRWSIEPMLVEYERLSAEPQREIARVMDFIGVHEPYNYQERKTTSRKLRSDINQRLADAYRQAYGDA